MYLDIILLSLSICLSVCLSTLPALLSAYLFVPILCKGATCSITKTIGTVLSSMVLVVYTACIIPELKVYVVRSPPPCLYYLK